MRCLNCDVAIPSVEDFCSLACQVEYMKESTCLLLSGVHQTETSNISATSVMPCSQSTDTKTKTTDHIADANNSETMRKKNRSFVPIVERDNQDGLAWGILFRIPWKSFWWGWHWSNDNQRLCVNIPLPFITFWFMRPGGKKP